MNAIEVDADRFAMLKNNLQILHFATTEDNGGEMHHSERNEHSDLHGHALVRLFHDDFLSIIASLHQDVIFLDCPWGGRDYKQQGESLTEGQEPFFLVLEKLMKDVTRLTLVISLSLVVASRLVSWGFP